MEDKIKQGVYEHYSGKRYQLVGVAKHSENLEELVVYKALYGEGQIWVRPIGMWFEEVECEGKKMPRFRLVE